MDIQAEKLWLIDQILKSQDIAILQNVKHLFEQNKTAQAETAADFWQELPKAQQDQVEQSINLLEKGEGISHDVVMETFRQKYEQ